MKKSSLIFFENAFTSASALASASAAASALAKSLTLNGQGAVRRAILSL